MPMANKNMTTVARLAMGTAMLTVISGCETGVDQGFSDLIAPVAGTDAASQTAQNAVTAAVPEVSVIAPEYVLPGAPTYTESSQAANVQAFESVYGPPVVDVASGSFAPSESFAIPSYDDGTVLSQPIAAPVAIPAPETATYTQRILDLGEETIISEPVYGPPQAAVDDLVYGETLTSAAYSVSPEPTVLAAQEPLSYAGPEPVMTEIGSYDSNFILEADAMIAASAPVETEALPLPFAGTDIFAEPMISETVMVAEAETPVEMMMATEPFVEPQQVALPAPEPAMAVPLPIPASGGVEIMSNDEIEAAYSIDAMPVDAPAMDVVAAASERIGGQFQITSMPTITQATMEPIRTDEPIMETSGIEIAALTDIGLQSQPVPQITATPAPRPKAILVTSALAATDYSPETAPAPRRRPSVAERSYATLSAPVPQPRPNFKSPVTMATSASNYVSIGALPAQPGFDAPAVSDDVMLPSDATNGNAMRDTAPGFEVASVRMPEPQKPALTKPARLAKASELSGTSWRLVKVGADPVSATAELHFDGSSGFAGGQGPCNSYGGEFINTGKGKFSMADIFSTEVSCSSLDIEKRYIGALESATMYKIAPGFSDLTLIDDNGRELARFQAF